MHRIRKTNMSYSHIKDNSSNDLSKKDYNLKMIVVGETGKKWCFRLLRWQRKMKNNSTLKSINPDPRKNEAFFR